MTDADLAETYDEAPCGQLTTDGEGEVVRANRTLARWLERDVAALVGVPVAKLLTFAGGLLYETHIAPMLRMQGHVGELALDLAGPEGRALPVLVWARASGEADGAARQVRFVFAAATTRREYERELQAARARAEQAADMLRAQAELLAEHSALLMPISDELRVMPVIGEIDEQRGRQMLRALLHLDGATGVRAVILDLTGVPRVDAAAATVLRHAAAGLRLRGVRPIITGIRPAVAAALVAGGIDLSAIAVRSTLQAGIALATRGPAAR